MLNNFGSRYLVKDNMNFGFTFYKIRKMRLLNALKAGLQKMRRY